jgi:hypothetical protein
MKELLNPTFPCNVVDKNGETPIIHGELMFLNKVIKNLEEQMGDSFAKWNFTLHYRHFSEGMGSKVNFHHDPARKNALILLADEHGRFPESATQGFDVVFRQYMEGPIADPRFHPFPVGYHEAAGLAEIIPFDKRKTNLFFSGYRNRNRVDLYKQFRNIWWLPPFNLPGRHLKELARRMVDRFCPERDFSARYDDSIIRFTEWFGKGLPPEEYALTLANTRIAVCPPGFISSETIRHWEAMRLGCVIITAPLPDNIFYKNSPMIVMTDWSNLHHTIVNLIANPQKLLEIHKNTVIWWEKYCCEKAVASYMANILRGNS